MVPRVPRRMVGGETGTPETRVDNRARGNWTRFRRACCSGDVFILHLMIHVALFERRLVNNRLVHFCSPPPPGIFCLPPDFVQLADVPNFDNEKSESVVNRGPTCSFFFTFKLMLCALKDSQNRMYEHPSSLKLRTNLLYNE